MIRPDCVWPIGALLGEGPVWSAADNALWFTDIKGRRLHRYTPATGAKASFEVPFEAGFVVPAASGGLIVGMDNALHRFAEDEEARRIVDVAAPPGTRINDGTVDRNGRIWFGTMDAAETRCVGALHRHDDDGEIRPAGGAAIVTNGPAFSLDGEQLYHVDTSQGLIWRFRVGDEGTLRDAAVFARIDEADGYPDGVTVDGEDCVWVGLWAGACVRRYAKDGRLIASVPLPVLHVTKLAFGGDDLRTAFVTTARVGLTAEALAAQPLAGGLFAFDPGVAGIATPSARVGL